jgi:CRISPR system Cascade subunit CasA
MMSELSFNLVDKPWIPCVDLGGQHVLLGIRDLLQQAHVLRGVQHESPLTEAALLRVLLAIIHRAVDGPRKSVEWKSLYKLGRFDERMARYLKKWHHRFDLFSPDLPFYQTPGLLVVDREANPIPQTISSLILERASGNRKTLFDHTTAGKPVKVTPSEAAQILITAQMFSLGGLNRKTTNLFDYQFRFENATMVEGIFIVLTGNSFFETLMLNLLIYNDNEPIPNTDEDCPVWERKDIGKAITKRKDAKSPNGYLDYLTCKCRHIVLVPSKDKDGKIFVERIHSAQGEILSVERNPGFMSKKSKKGNWYHPQLNIDRLVWRDSSALFAFDENIDERPKAFRQIQAMKGLVALPSRYVCSAYAIANKDANPLAWRKEKMSVPITLLTEKNVVAHLERGMDLSGRAADALNAAAKQFMRVYLPNNSKEKDISDKVKASGVIQMYWGSMEPHFHQFLLDLDEPEGALEIWAHAVKRMARESLNKCLERGYRCSTRFYRAWSGASAHLNAALLKHQ